MRRLAGEAGTAGDPARAAALLGEALSVWRGEALADISDTLPFAPELARLAEWRRQLRDEWLGQQLRAGDAARALPDLEEAGAAGPLREPGDLLWRGARHAPRRTAEALAVAAAFRRRLAGEAGLDPSPALEELQRHLLTAPPAAPVQVRATRPPPPGDRFVGREAELAQLSAALTHHRLVTVVGPGGVGKTRLVREVVHRRADRLTAHLVELAETSVPDEVPAAVAAVLGLRTAPDGSRAAIVDRRLRADSPAGAARHRPRRARTGPRRRPRHRCDRDGRMVVPAARPGEGYGHEHAEAAGRVPADQPDVRRGPARRRGGRGRHARGRRRATVDPRVLAPLLVSPPRRVDGPGRSGPPRSR
ncbi:AAA family ATPase [Micromonospora sp. CPCC 205371]|nr:AAA family ATPase [Micromonospora sp. CPCC 205371]